MFVLTSFATLSSIKQETSFYNPWLLLQSIIWPKKKLYFRILDFYLQSIIWSGKKLRFRIFDLLQSAEYYRTSHMAVKSHQIMLEICETKKITKTWSKSFRFQIIWKKCGSQSCKWNFIFIKTFVLKVKFVRTNYKKRFGEVFAILCRRAEMVKKRTKNKIKPALFVLPVRLRYRNISYQLIAPFCHQCRDVLASFCLTWMKWQWIY